MGILFSKAIGDETSVFANVPEAPADPILGLATRFKADTFEKKAGLKVSWHGTVSSDKISPLNGL